MLLVHGGSIQRGVFLQTIQALPSVNVELSDIVKAGAAEENEHKTRRTETWITATILGEQVIYCTETKTWGLTGPGKTPYICSDHCLKG